MRIMKVLTKYISKNNYIIISMLIILFILSLFEISFVWRGWYVILYLYIVTHISTYIFIIFRTTYHLEGFATIGLYLLITVITVFAYIGFEITNYDYIILETPSQQEIVIIAKPIGLEIESELKLYKKNGILKKEINESSKVCLWRAPFEERNNEKKYYPYKKKFIINNLKFQWLDTNKLKISDDQQEWLKQPVIFHIP